MQTIDYSLLSQSDIDYLEKYGIISRINLYNQYVQQNNAKEAAKILESCRSVLSRDSNSDFIREHGAGELVGGFLAAVDYALQILQGHQPSIPFNNHSKIAGHIVIEPPKK